MFSKYQHFSPVRLSDGAVGESPATSEVQVLRVGEWKHPRYGKFEVTLDNIKELIASFDKRLSLNEFAVDQEHHPEKGAAGWFKRLFTKNDGNELWAVVEWTTDGAKLIKDKVFRYLSIDFFREWTDPETHAKYENVLNGAALTNRPFVSNMAPVVLSGNAAYFREQNMQRKFSAVPIDFYQALPDKEQAWNEAEAKQRWSEWAKSAGWNSQGDEINWNQYQTGFLWYDANNPEDVNSYALLHHDIIDGSPRTIYAALKYVADKLNSGDVGFDTTDENMAKMRAHIALHLAEYGESPPWDTAGEGNPVQASHVKLSTVAYKKYPVEDTRSWGFTAADGNKILEAYGGEESDAAWEAYKNAHAWFDSAADTEHSPPRQRGAYKLPHHKLDADGKMKTWPGGVIAAMAVVHGGRGGANIPDTELESVYNHLVKHYKDIGLDAPEFKGSARILTQEDTMEVSETAKTRIAELKKAGCTIEDEGVVAEMLDSMTPEEFGNMLSLIENMSKLGKTSLDKDGNLVVEPSSANAEEILGAAGDEDTDTEDGEEPLDTEKGDSAMSEQQLSQLNTKIKERDDRITALEKDVKEAKKKERMTGYHTRLSKLVDSGHMLPTEMAAYLSMLENETVEAVQLSSTGADGKPAQIPLIDKIEQMVKERPVQVDLTERSKRPDAARLSQAEADAKVGKEVAARYRQRKGLPPKTAAAAQ